MKTLKISIVAMAIFCSIAANAQISRPTPAQSQALPANRLPASGQIVTAPAGNSSPRPGAARSALQDINSGGVPPKTYVSPSAPQTVILPQTTLPGSNYPAGTVIIQPSTEEQTQTIDPASTTPSTPATAVPGNANQVVPSPANAPLNRQQAAPAIIGQPSVTPRSNAATPAPAAGSRPNQ